MSDAMYLCPRVRLSCSVALLSAWLTACPNTVVVEPSCAATCEEANPQGLEYYNNVNSECVCTGCSEACTQSVCNEKKTPSDACLPCVQASLRGEACEEAGLFNSGCRGHAECQAFIDCLTACPNG